MQWFRNLNAMPRLLASFGVLIVLAIGVNMLAISKLAESNREMSSLYGDDLLGTLHVGNMNVDRYDIGRISRDAFLNAGDAKILADDEKTFQTRFDSFHTELDGAEKTFYTPEGLATIKIVRDGLSEWQKSQSLVFDRLHARDLAGAKAALAHAALLGKPISAALDHAAQLKQNRAEKKADENTAAYNSTRILMLVATVFSTAFGIFLAIVIARGFSAPPRCGRRRT